MWRGGTNTGRYWFIGIGNIYHSREVLIELFRYVLLISITSTFDRQLMNIIKRMLYP